MEDKTIVYRTKIRAVPPTPGCYRGLAYFPQYSGLTAICATTGLGRMSNDGSAFSNDCVTMEHLRERNSPPASADPALTFLHIQDQQRRAVG
jgi:hypothetical protein